MRSQGRRAISPVIATVILAGAVLAIGGALWSYSLGAATVIADNYVNGTLSLLNDITERYNVEHVAVSSDSKTLSIWVNNYGKVNIVVDLYVNATNHALKSSFSNAIDTGTVSEVQISYSGDPLVDGDVIVIKVYSRRQNLVYYTFYN